MNLTLYIPHVITYVYHKSNSSWTNVCQRQHYIYTWKIKAVAQYTLSTYIILAQLSSELPSFARTKNGNIKTKYAVLYVSNAFS